MRIRIKDKIVRVNDRMWLILEATDMKTAEAAIGLARATGSVGATEQHQNAGKPHGNGKILKYAKVNRIELVKPS